MGRRIFIAINLPEDIRKKLADFRKNWPDLPARWTKPENLHITLVFLGYVRDENLPTICQKIEKVCQNRDGFEIVLNKICYGPADKKPSRMIWAMGNKSQELANLQADLEKILFSGINQNMEKYLPKIKKEIRPFSPHITLARLKQMQFRQMEERPEINENINLKVDVNSIEIMESQLRRTGPVYTILESIKLE